MSAPNLRIILDDDSMRVYRRGDRVTGRVILVTAEQETFESLVVCFHGLCITTTSPPFPLDDNAAEGIRTEQNLKESIQLFKCDQNVLSQRTLSPRKHCWTFDFKFPELTQPKFGRWSHGSKYHREPHALPPSFRMRTASGGKALISYSVQALLARNGSRSPITAEEVLPYHPTPRGMTVDAKVVSRVLYAQTWKPLGGRTAVDKAISCISRRSSTSADAPRIIPTLYYPERISPGQHIPLLLSLTDSQEQVNGKRSDSTQCILDSLAVSITTHTTSTCSYAVVRPEDIMAKHVVCLSKSNIGTPVPFGTRIKLTNNFRLIDDAECVPSFKTYTITRRYDLIVAIGLKYGDHSFRIRCTTLLDILPRIPREMLPSLPDDGDYEVDPLPLYVPREPSAPDYDSLYSLSAFPSSSSSSSFTRSRSTSSSATSSGLSTPALENKQPYLEGIPAQAG